MALRPNLTRVIVSDVHGNYESLRCLLAEIGVIDYATGVRQSGFFVVQVGDLFYMKDTTRAGDVAVALPAETWFDHVVCGNHELWYAWRLRAGAFTDMTSIPEVEVTRTINRMIRKGWLNAAFAVDEWLVTHAGIHRTYQQSLTSNPVGAARQVNDRFERRILDKQEDPLFDSIGRIRSRGREPKAGGLFWIDIVELAQSGTRLQQIVGHTPLSTKLPTRIGHNIWGIDPGFGRVSALVRKGPKGEWTQRTSEGFKMVPEEEEERSTLHDRDR